MKKDSEEHPCNKNVGLYHFFDLGLIKVSKNFISVPAANDV